MIAGQSVGVLYDSFFIDIHEDLLATHCADTVREVLGRHA